MRNVLRMIGTVIAAAVLSSCSLFGGDDEDEKLEPTKLVDIVTQVTIKRLWRAKVGDTAEFLRVALRPAGDGNRIYAASRDGNVVAFQPESGKQVWRTKLDTELSAGPGVGEGLVIIAASAETPSNEDISRAHII